MKFCAGIPAFVISPRPVLRRLLFSRRAGYSRNRNVSRRGHHFQWTKAFMDKKLLWTKAFMDKSFCGQKAFQDGRLLYFLLIVYPSTRRRSGLYSSFKGCCRTMWHIRSSGCASTAGPNPLEFEYNGEASFCRGVAQPGSAPALGAGGHRFKSCRPDHSTLGESSQ